MANVVSNNYDARYKIASREAFRNRTGSFWAENIREGYVPGTFGWLPPKYMDSLLWKENVTYRPARYVVYSYATPIAWWSADEGWTIPDAKYSRTTTKHQSIARMGIQLHNRDDERKAS